MSIHKEGTQIILCAALLAAVVTVLTTWLLPETAAWIVSAAAWALALFVCYFFRSPRRVPQQEAMTVFSAADGEIVALEEVEENEYFHDTRLVVSVFMSIWNVHINWFPVAGRVIYYRYHPGKFLVAWHPKSSEDNERTTTVVDTGTHRVLFRQIAGIVARRIVSYAPEGSEAHQGAQFGFIKFGSRIDLFLPKDSEVLVKLGDKVVGTQTPIARLKASK